ncbi:hypothetical protein RRG08_053370 [Elysia crispata]|uniref:EGF-like domain-containing protein n=1 Tax=Elysia crispata TaxID=231223 RepID=A0AAE0Z792_9GAST|nr:hypothetical protein RRG08_053370 [Elysia crispata]
MKQVIISKYLFPFISHPECQPGRYGDRCDKSCSATCGGDNSCDRASGACSHGCDPGYLGTTCETMCGPGTYEAGCSELCSVNCAGPDNACNHVTGVTGHCESCPPGFTGAGCDQKCPSGSYGEECAATCSDHCAGDQNPCHHVNGTCDLGCDPGYQGSSCTQVCPRGRHGQGCSQICSVQCVGPDRPCHPVDGSCYQGCVHDDKISNCQSAALNRDESDDSGVKTWAVVTTVVASVAGVVLIIAAFAIGILVRNNKLSRDGSSTSADRGNNREVETASLGNECRQKPVQQSTVENERPNHYYESMESHPGHVHLIHCQAMIRIRTKARRRRSKIMLHLKTLMVPPTATRRIRKYPVVDGLSEVTLKSSRHKNKWSSFFHSLSCGETFM